MTYNELCKIQEILYSETSCISDKDVSPLIQVISDALSIVCDCSGLLPPFY
jgi:hypothetical protein